MIEGKKYNYDDEKFKFPEQGTEIRAEGQSENHEQDQLLSREAEVAREKSESMKLSEVRETIDDLTTMPDTALEPDRGRPPLADDQAEVVTVGGVDYKVKYVAKEEIYPAYGYATGHLAEVREDLSPRVKRFVRAHELYHCQDKASWGGEFGSEVRANIVPGLKDPIGLLATVAKTITDPDRLKFYLNRMRKG